MRLSERLNILFDACVPGLPLWDLACDHGHLGLQALETKRASFVTFCDQSDLAMKALSQHPVLKKHTENSKVIRDDFCNLQIPDRPSNIVLAGLGFHKIKKFVEKNRDLQNIRYILHPAKHPELMSPFMQQFGFEEKSHVTCIEKWEEHIFTYEKSKAF